MLLRCGRCEAEKDEEEFNKKKTNKSGRLGTCKDCLKKYREDHREEIKTKKALRYLENKKEINAKNKARYEANRDEINARRKVLYYLNHDENLAKQKIHRETHAEEKKIRDAKWRAEHKEYRRQYDMVRREKNPEENKNRCKKRYSENPAPYKERAKRRELLLKGSTIEIFTNLEIFERDRWICSICHKKVDKRLKWPNPMCVELEHIIPLSKGGQHSRANTACSHRACNQRKHDGTVPQQMNLIG